MKAENTTTLKGAPAEVFAAFEDPEVIAQWQDNMLEFEQLEGSFQEAGGVARMQVRNAGLTQDMTVTVVERDARKFKVKYHYDGAQVPFTIANSFKDNGDGTTEWKAVLDAKIPLIAKALELALKPLANKLVGDNGKNFGAWCDKNL